jgi:N-acetylglucosaminyl-diphospho-decaprenol L-rhamnosyltransferase
MESKTEVKLRVFILHWNRPEECLATIAVFQKQNVPLSICVIDNASRRETLDLLRSRLPAEVELLLLDQNRGWGGGHNVGLKRWLEVETSEFCIVSAHDSLPEPECFTMLLKAMRDDPKLGMVCPQYQTNEVGVFSPIRGPRIIMGTPGASGTVLHMDFIHGTLMLYRRDCLKQTGLFDERYFAYGDEYDLALRAGRYGWKVGLVWGSIVINPGSWVGQPVLTYLSTRGTMLLARDYGGRVAAAIRAVLVILNSIRFAFMPAKKRHFLCHPKARIAAVRDFYLGRFGAPPPMG